MILNQFKIKFYFLECLILFNSINEYCCNRTEIIPDQLDDETITQKILNFLDSKEFIYIFILFVILIFVCFVCIINCKVNSSVKNRPVGSVQSIRNFLSSKLLGFSNIDERLAKDSDFEIKSIDSSGTKSRQSDGSKLNTSTSEGSKLMLSNGLSKSDASFPLKLNFKHKNTSH